MDHFLPLDCRRLCDGGRAPPALAERLHRARRSALPLGQHGPAFLPYLFDPGDPLNLSMQARNTSTVPLTGTAILRIEDGSGGPIQTFQKGFGGLAPEGIAPVDALWDTSGIGASPYRLIGYAL